MADKHLWAEMFRGQESGENRKNTINPGKVSLLMERAIVISLTSILTFDSKMIQTDGVLMIMKLQLGRFRLQHRFEYIPWVL